MKTRFTAASDAGLLLGRLMMAALFLPFGIIKAMSFGNTVGMLGAMHAPMPELAAAIAVFCETVLPVLVVIGFLTRPVALLLVLYTAGTTYIAHRFWLMPPAQVMEAQINFYKNVAILRRVSAPGERRARAVLRRPRLGYIAPQQRVS